MVRASVILIMLSVLLTGCGLNKPKPAPEVVYVPVVKEIPHIPEFSLPHLPIFDLNQEDEHNPNKVVQSYGASILILQKEIKERDNVLDALREYKESEDGKKDD